MEDFLSKEIGIEDNDKKQNKKGHKDDFFYFIFSNTMI